ncbi:MAG: PAC2 family protein, partial [Dehalococcoidia bacterium]
GDMGSVANGGDICHYDCMRIGNFELPEPVPELRNPHVISSLTPWVDAGSVGSLTLERLERFMGASDLGQLERPGRFFDFTRYRPVMYTEGTERRMNVPNTQLRYAEGPGDTDFIFMHMLEPHSMAEDYIDSIVEVLEHLQVKRFCRVGAMYDAVPHTRPLLVMGTLNGQPLTGVPGVEGNRRNPYQGPSSIMNMVGDRLGQQGIDAMTLMIRLPHYVELEADFAGRTAALRVLCNMYNLPQEYYFSRRDTQQYARVTSEMQNNPQVKALVERLESDYDKRMGVIKPESEDGGQDNSPLPPSIEQFLGELGRRDDDSKK